MISCLHVVGLVRGSRDFSQPKGRKVNKGEDGEVRNGGEMLSEVKSSGNGETVEESLFRHLDPLC